MICREHFRYAYPVSHYFYLARCSDGSLYAGTAADLKEREAKHNAGKGAKYTQSRRPVRIVYREKFTTLSAARRREAEVKRWKRGEKLRLIGTTIGTDR